MIEAAQNIEPPAKPTSASSTAAHTLLDGIYDGVHERIEEVKADPVRFGLELAGSAAVGVGMAALQSTPWGKAIATAAQLTFAFDVGRRVGESGYATIDSAFHPESQAKDQRLVADTLGHGLFDYGTMLGTGGLAYGGSKLLASGMLSSGTFMPSMPKAFQANLTPAFNEGTRFESVFGELYKTSSRDNVRLPQFHYTDGGDQAPTWIETQKDSPLTKLYMNAARSTVRITGEDAFGRQASGSGFVIDKEGTIATNFHVVHGARNIAVETFEGDHLFAMPVARDVQADLGLIRVVGKPANVQLHPVKLAASSAMKHDAVMTAVGHPLGVGVPVLSFGLYKGPAMFFDRNPNLAPSPDLIPKVGSTVMNMPIKPGFSGSQVFAEDGSVVGVASSFDGGKVAHAVPVEHLNALYAQVQKTRPLNSWLDIRSNYSTDYSGKPQVSVWDVTERPNSTLDQYWHDGGYGRHEMRQPWIVPLPGAREYMEQFSGRQPARV